MNISSNIVTNSIYINETGPWNVSLLALHCHNRNAMNLCTTYYKVYHDYSQLMQ